MTAAMVATSIACSAVQRNASQVHVQLPTPMSLVVCDDGAMPCDYELRSLLGALVQSGKAAKVRVTWNGAILMEDAWMPTAVLQPPSRSVSLTQFNLDFTAHGGVADAPMLVCQALERLALVHFGLAFSLKVGSTEPFEFRPCRDSVEAFERLYGLRLEYSAVVPGVMATAQAVSLTQYGQLQLCIDPHTLQVAPPEVTARIARRLGTPAVKSLCRAFLALLPTSQWPCAAAGATPAAAKRHRPSASSSTPSLADLVEMGASLRSTPRKTPRATPALRVTVHRADLGGDVILVGQFNREFILVATAAGKLLCFDQHAAHERVRFEQFQREYAAASAAKRTVKAVHPPVVVLSERALNIDVLRARGFALEAVGARQFAVSSVPVVMGVALQPGDALQQADSPGVLPPSVLAVLASKACRGAVFFGDALDHATMHSIVRGLASCDFPFQCAHGRPSVVPLTHG